MPADINDSSEIIQKFQRDFQEHEHHFTEKEKEIFELRSTINKLQSDLFNEQNKQAHEKK